ncbi:MAG: hypothetical protein HC908_03970 [Calothrix sp. SM1_7_51]|nr:hypothetical protein [Calothrix sp. SM1_7_51]
MLKPAYKIIIGRKFFDTTDEPKASNVVDLTVKLDIETPTDSATLVLGNVNSLNPARDDQVKIELGYEDNGGLAQVMVGSIVTVEPDITTKRVIAYTSAQTLLRTYIDQTYESKTAGQIVEDLVSRASSDGLGAISAAGSALASLTGQTTLEVANAEDGINFPAYVIDSNRSIYYHMGDLADLCGFDLYINSEGKLVFEKFTGGKTVHVFEYAKDIINIEVKRTPPRATQVEAWGESPAGRGGANSWAWLTNNFRTSTGITGNGNPKYLLERPALRTSAAARTAAEATLTTFQRQTLRGKILVLGNPQVKLGDAIRLQNLPDSTLNQTFQIRKITHRLTKKQRFHHHY